MTTPDERQVDPLGRYWNEVAAGGPALPHDLDPTLAAIVRRLQAIGAAPTPDPAFAAHLWEDLMHQAHAAPLPHPRLVPRLGASQPGGAPGAKRPPSPIRFPTPGRWWPRVEFVAVSLLAVALAAGLAALNGGLPDRLGAFLVEEEPPAAAPARMLAFGNVVEISPHTGERRVVALRRITLASGATWKAPLGAYIVQVESGTPVVRYGRPGEDGYEESLWRPGFSSGGENTPESTQTFHNDGSAPAVLLEALIGPGVQPATTNEGVTVEVLGGGVVDSLPGGPALFTVTGHEMDAGERVEEIDTGRDGLALIAVESGTVSVYGRAAQVELERAATIGSDPRPQGSEQVPLATGDSALLHGGAFLSASNPTDAPVRFLILAVEPSAAMAQQRQGAGGESVADSAYGEQAVPEPRATPTTDAEVPGAEACQVTPRSAASIEDIRRQGLATPFAGDEFVETPSEDQLPQGTPLDAATLALLTAAEREFAACYNAGDTPRVLALVTDDIAREILLDLPVALEETLSGTPRPQPADDRIALFPLRGARVLPDGRLGAIVDWARPGDSLRAVSESDFHVYERVDGRWLIADEISTGR